MEIKLSQHLFRYKNGIKLLASTDSQCAEKSIGYTVAAVLALPFNFYFLDTAGNTQLMNNESAQFCGFASADEAIGKSLFAVSTTNSANQLIENCKYVIQAQVMNIFEEQHHQKDGISHHFLSIKCPWYDCNNEVKGVFGCSIVLGLHGLAKSLSTIINLGLFENDANLRKTPYDNLKIKLSKREMECFRLTLKGFTAKKIGKNLGISHRTVEEYLVNIRAKTGANSKAELLEMFC